MMLELTHALDWARPFAALGNDFDVLKTSMVRYGCHGLANVLHLLSELETRSVDELTTE
jgi:hypothetical protein